MNANPPRGKSLALEPVEGSIPAGEAPRAVAEAATEAKNKRDLRITTADEFLKAAAKEYQEGSLDSALWRQAADQCGSDPSLVVAAYLRARATQLRQQEKQDERPQRQARREVEPDPPLESASTEGIGARLRDLDPKLKYLAAAAAALAFVGIGVWLIASPRDSGSVQPRVASAAVPAPSRTAPATRLPSAQQPIAGVASQDGLDTPIETRVRELKQAGNWNVFVLYASTWTRKEPKNAAAWRELSVGYTNLRQFGDALDTANKAVQLAPEDSSPWSNLGHVNLVLERWPEASTAYDKALALNPDDLDALCGAALVAQKQGRPKDADALAKRVKSPDAACPGASDSVRATSVADGSTTRNPVRRVGR